MRERIRSLSKWLIVFLAVFWVALTYSKNGVLVSGGAKTITSPGSGKETRFLVCKYFTGMGFVVKDIWSAKTGANQSCPVIVDLRGQ